jgi:hypothetical protein
LAGDAPSLIDAAKIPSTEEANVSFPSQASTSLLDLEKILTIVCEEAEQYDLFKVSTSFKRDNHEDLWALIWSFEGELHLFRLRPARDPCMGQVRGPA